MKYYELYYGQGQISSVRLIDANGAEIIHAKVTDLGIGDAQKSGFDYSISPYQVEKLLDGQNLTRVALSDDTIFEIREKGPKAFGDHYEVGPVADQSNIIIEEA